MYNGCHSDFEFRMPATADPLHSHCRGTIVVALTHIGPHFDPGMPCPDPIPMYAGPQVFRRVRNRQGLG
jgi:hypothetical protein